MPLSCCWRCTNLQIEGLRLLSSKLRSARHRTLRQHPASPNPAFPVAIAPPLVKSLANDWLRFLNSTNTSAPSPDSCTWPCDALAPSPSSFKTRSSIHIQNLHDSIIRRTGLQRVHSHAVRGSPLSSSSHGCSGCASYLRPSRLPLHASVFLSLSQLEEGRVLPTVQFVIEFASAILVLLAIGDVAMFWGG